MKFAEPLESQRLSFLLEKAASKEARMWKVYVPKKGLTQDTQTRKSLWQERALDECKVQDTDISHDQRDEAVRWLTALHSKLHLYPETLSLAISILDRFLASIKARPKYLRCIAIACFFLATKTSEEDERVPLLPDLASSSSCGCSPSEILRMERIILDKLSWDLHAATPLEFLQIFHAMVRSCKSPFLVGLLGLNPSQHVALLTQRLHRCLADHALLQFRGSMLALALITLELETCCPDWLALTIDLLRKAQIDSSQLIRCRELVEQSLSTSQASLPPNTVYIYQPLHQSLVPRNQGGPVGGPQPRAPTPAQEPPRRDGGPRRAPSTTTQLVTLKPYRHPHLHLPQQQVHLRCKHSSKRKVEEMEVDDFYDGIKRLYNEESVQDGVAGEGPGLGCGVRLVWPESSTSPCPPLQPVSVT